MDTWPYRENVYTPDLEDGIEVKSAFEGFAKSHLSDETSVNVISSRSGSAVDETVNEKQLLFHLDKKDTPHCQIFFINRFLIRKKQTTRPPDAAKLRISPTAFLSLTSRLKVAPSFIFALSRYYLPTGKGQSILKYDKINKSHDFWYFLPVRMQVRCTDSQLKHTSSTGGSNQMNPFHYLHLQDHNADIRGAQIAVYFRYSTINSSVSMIAVNLIDGRWPQSVEEPQRRTLEALNHSNGIALTTDPFFIHLIYFTSVIRWWTNALDSLNMQLISYEGRLQDQPAPDLDSNAHEDLNKSLHAIASHLHRYASELSSLSETLFEIRNHHILFYTNQEFPNEVQFHRVENGLSQIASQLQSIKHFELELEKKLQNILALLFNRIQLSNDRLMVASTTAMQQILSATQVETLLSRSLAKRAYELTEEMKKDSLSMKTIAVLTMFFLPGTSFAALLSMPFFSSNGWLDDVSKFWVWVVLTVPSTGFAFAFYVFWKHRGEQASKVSTDSEDGFEMGAMTNTAVDEGQ